MKNKETLTPLISADALRGKIYTIRGKSVMLDRDLAEIYGYSTKAFNQQVKNNLSKFDETFRFQLSFTELQALRSNFLTANVHAKSRTLPYVFTEQGIYMLMTILKGDLATRQSIALIKLFKKLKDTLAYQPIMMETLEFVNLANQVRENSFEAYIAYKMLFSQATSEIYLVDNYVSAKTLLMFRDVSPQVKITIFTDNKGSGLRLDEWKTFRCSNPQVKIMLRRTGNSIHDRFIILDPYTPKQNAFVCGASLKDSGKRLTTISSLENPEIIQVILSGLQQQSALQWEEA